MKGFKTTRVRCPHCGYEFATGAVAALSYTGRDSDFRPHFKQENAMLAFVAECPRCGYVDWFSEFLRGRKVHVPEEALRVPRGRNPFLRLARSYEIRGMGPFAIAEAYHYAAWFARSRGWTDEERLALERATRWFEAYLSRNGLEETRVPIITYLVGELHRMLGNFERAIEYFDSVLSMKLPEGLAWIRRLAWVQREFAEKRDCGVKLMPH